MLHSCGAARIASCRECSTSCCAASGRAARSSFLHTRRRAAPPLQGQHHWRQQQRYSTHQPQQHHATSDDGAASRGSNGHHHSTISREPWVHSGGAQSNYTSPPSASPSSTSSTSSPSAAAAATTATTTAVSSSNEVRTLQAQVRQLSQLVCAQQAQLKEHEAALQKMQWQWQQQQQKQPRRQGDDIAASDPASLACCEEDEEEGRGDGVVLTPFEAQRAGVGDRRYLGLFDARYHSTRWCATPKDYRILPDKIILVRHAQSVGNVDNAAYTYIPDPQVPLTGVGRAQAYAAGQTIKRIMDETARPGYRLFFYTSPYIRSLQTYTGIREAFASSQVCGVQEETQLREQDFGNFQDAVAKLRQKDERQRFGRFFYRFHGGESGADVYDRVTIFEDHLIRDLNAGRFGDNTSLVLITHGLALRIFLMRWFGWTVDDFMCVYNPPNAKPLVLERTFKDTDPKPLSWVHTKSLYRLTDDSMAILKGCTASMCTNRWLQTQN